MRRSRFGIKYSTVRQSRHEATTGLEFSAGPDAMKKTIADPIRSIEVNLTTAFPLGAGLSVGPYARYYVVKAVAASGLYTSARYGIALTVPFSAKAGHGAFLY
jgi:hypothetical protein